ncbi:MAG: ABC transporter ATP-binding protein [Acidimicrobiales bacterium]
MTRLVIDDLHKAYGTLPVLRGLHLLVPAGSLTAILGPSGSGKTTLLRTVAGFERADQGTIGLGDEVIDDAHRCFVPPERRGIGYVPQEGNLFPHLTVARNVGFGLRRGDLDRAGRAARVEELLAMVGLTGLGRRYPSQLSGGQQQRVALARALAVDPQLVLLDEPFSSLDAGLRSSVRSDVLGVLRRAGTTAVLVTHDQNEALSTADHVAVIREGRIGQLDRPDVLYASPVDADLAQFVGEANLVPGRVEDGTVSTPLGPLDLAPGPADGSRCPVLEGSVTALIRPEQIQLHRDGADGRLTGHVLDYEYFGHDAVVRVRPSDPAVGPVLVVRTTGRVPWALRSEVGLRAHGSVVVWPRE